MAKLLPCSTGHRGRGQVPAFLSSMGLALVLGFRVLGIPILQLRASFPMEFVNCRVAVIAKRLLM